jgi:hypothetical protein
LAIKQDSVQSINDPRVGAIEGCFEGLDEVGDETDNTLAISYTNNTKIDSIKVIMKRFEFQINQTIFLKKTVKKRLLG